MPEKEISKEVPAELTKTVDIRAIDVDIHNYWRPNSVFVTTQEVGEDHSTILGYSHADLGRKFDAFFVLMRQKFIMDQYPRFGDKVQVVTWAGKIRRTIFPRYYVFLDGQGKQCGYASTLWMLCSLRERKVMSPEKAGIILPEPLRPALPDPEKLHSIETFDKTVRRESRYSDIDYNGHMNNTRYADWICDLFDLSRYETHHLHELQVNYIAEVRGEKTLDLALREEGDRFFAEGKSTEDSRVFFQATGVWQEK